LKVAAMYVSIPMNDERLWRRPFQVSYFFPGGSREPANSTIAHICPKATKVTARRMVDCVFLLSQDRLSPGAYAGDRSLHVDGQSLAPQPAAHRHKSFEIVGALQF
jgi:hypothetical protein